MSAQSISALIPTFNRADVLAETVRSIMAQSLQVDEIIVADDGSTDHTAEVVDELKRSNPEWKDRLIYFRQENQGKSVALNAALKRARGEWIAFNDSDDLWVTSKLEKQLLILKRHPECGACVSDTLYGSDGGTTTLQIAGVSWPDACGELADAPKVFSGLSHGIMMQTLMVRKKLLDQVGGFNPILRAGQDVDILFRISLKTRFCYVNEPLVVLDRAPERASRLTVEYPMQSAARLGMRVRMMEQWVELVQTEDGDLKTSLNRRLASARSALANRLLSENEIAAAAGQLRAAYEGTHSPRLLAKWILIRLVPGFARKWMTSPETAAAAST